MSEISLPFDPLRDHLYTSRELFDGFSAGDPDSYARSPDIAVLSYFVRHGKNPTADHRVSTLEALHDNSISEALEDLLHEKTKVVAIMGGHDMNRGTRPYADIAHIAHALSAAGFLVVSGGGPGAMEASHLGAAYSALAIAELDAAIDRLAGEVALPGNAASLVDANGHVDARIARDLHKWFTPAMAIVHELGDRIGESLGVPTWLYGFEPTTPFATHTAKYFQNSLREDGLVTMGVQGIIYAEGGAGTVQEIFQDAAQNFYDAFSPMVFLSSPDAPGRRYWESTLPVRPLIEALLGKKPDFQAKVLFTDSARTTIDFLCAQKARTVPSLRSFRPGVKTTSC
ncbi:MAG: hypothetical protein ACM3SQ_15800 [Betaproteobacteria bacterium]